MLYADSDRLWYAGAGFDPILGRSRHEGFGEPDAAGELADTRRATGAAMAVSRAAIDAAGLLDEELFLYAEDLEWSLRIHEAGFAVVYVPAARVRHRVSERSGRRGLADDEVLRDAQHARGGRALPAAAAGADRSAARARRRPARPARRAPAGLGVGGGARLARLPARADGASALACRDVANERSSFYRRVLERLLEDGTFRRDLSVLVVAGGPADRDAFHELGFENVTISNVDESMAAEALAPYTWSYQDAENLDYADGSFDVTVVSAGLHHCRSPHRALLELYRVARVAALALESRDSALMRVAVKLGAVDEYELAAVAAHGLRSGGVANTSTPNYVYRWSEREVEKTVASFAPHARHRIRYFREFELPEALVESDRGARARFLRVARPVVDAVTHVLPRQANLFAFVIEKPDAERDLQPWMVSAEEPNERVIGGRYTIER